MMLLSACLSSTRARALHAPPARVRVACAMLLVVISAQAALGAETAAPPRSLVPASTAPSEATSIADFAWLEGAWRGSAFGGIAEETWAAASGGTMVGMFKLVAGDAVAFYEIFTISRAGDGWVLKLKHFNADLTGWEEKGETVDFPLLRMAPRAAEFDGLTYERVHEDTLVATVAIHEDDGSEHEVTIRFHRVER